MRKIVKRSIWLGFILTLITAMINPCIKAYAEDVVTVKLPYNQTFTNDSALTNVDDTFQYRITPIDGAPMPADTTNGGYIFSLEGTTQGTIDIDITYSHPGYFKYEVTSYVPQSVRGYTYATKIYTVTVTIANGETGLIHRATVIQDEDLSKYGELPFDVTFYQARPVPTPTPQPAQTQPATPANPTRPAPAPAPQQQQQENVQPAEPTPEPQEIVVTPEPTPEPTPTPTPEVIEDEPTPEAGPRTGERYWALLNLLSMIATVLIAVILGILYFKNKKKDDEEEDKEETNKTSPENEEDDEDEQKLKRKGLARIASIVVGIVSFIFFFLTEDIRLPMRWWDKWTIYMLIMLLINIILAFLSRKKVEDSDDEEEEQPEN